MNRGRIDQALSVVVAKTATIGRTDRRQRGGSVGNGSVGNGSVVVVGSITVVVVVFVGSGTVEVVFVGGGSVVVGGGSVVVVGGRVVVVGGRVVVVSGCGVGGARRGDVESVAVVVGDAAVGPLPGDVGTGGETWAGGPAPAMVVLGCGGPACCAADNVAVVTLASVAEGTGPTGSLLDCEGAAAVELVEYASTCVVVAVASAKPVCVAMGTPRGCELNDPMIACPRPEWRPLARTNGSARTTAQHATATDLRDIHPRGPRRSSSTLLTTLQYCPTSPQAKRGRLDLAHPVNAPWWSADVT